jgi:hypothetical protein
MSIHFAGTELAALIVATSFAAGLNVYATIATMGLLSHAGSSEGRKYEWTTFEGNGQIFQ